MTAPDAFRTMVTAKIGPLLRTAGFKASVPTWRLRSGRGDLALVNLQKYWWNHGNEVNFYVNLAIVPAVWWQYLSQEVLDKPPASALERHGLLRRRLDGPIGDARARDGWLIRDAGSADDCAEVLHDQLERVAIPELRKLLDRDYLITFIRDGAKGWWVTQKPELAMAYVIADQGLSPRLNEILDAFDRAPNPPRDAERSAWLRLRASAVHDHD